jgi:hypothetical protein
VVVSEERGSISLCFGGNIARDLDSPTLRKALLGLFQKQKRRSASQKQKEREVPTALEALPFERPQPLEEADSSPTQADSSQLTADSAERKRPEEATDGGGGATGAAAADAKPVEG